VRFVVNYAYHLEREVRNVAGALNHFGTPFPSPERREMLARTLDLQREYLQRLEPLARAFGIDGMEQLLKQEPDGDALIMSSNCAEIVMHGDDLTEMIVPWIIRFDKFVDMHQRMRKALTRSEYKAWNLSEDALHFFDTDSDVIKKDDLARLLPVIVRRGIDRGITQCQLRRRVNQVNNGVVRFWDAANERAPQGPQMTTGF